MAIRDFPPFPLRDADEYSRYLSRGLVLAYLMHEGRGATIKNYGTWGEQANLSIIGADWSRRDSGLYGLHFTDNTDVASNTVFSQTIPEEWSYAVWVKSDIAQSGTAEIFSFYDSNLPQVRAYTDVVGVWSWQKRSIADTFTVLPPADFPDDGTRLIVSVFNGIGIPPVQLRTGKNMNGLPRKPANYATFNSGQGTQAETFSSMFLGNAEGNINPWKGTIGPFYFWDRAISVEEVQALKEDPYAPFRRDQALKLVPATMISQMTTKFHPTDDNGSGVSLSSDDDLFIFIKDDFQYLNIPEESFVGENEPVLGITVLDSYQYVDNPTDTAPNGAAIGNPIIEVLDTYTYIGSPSDEGEALGSGIPLIEVNDSHTYLSSPADVIPNSGAQVPVGITSTDTYNYIDSPTDNGSSNL